MNLQPKGFRTHCDILFAIQKFLLHIKICFKEKEQVNGLEFPIESGNIIKTVGDDIGSKLDTSFEMIELKLGFHNRQVSLYRKPLLRYQSSNLIKDPTFSY